MEQKSVLDLNHLAALSGAELGQVDLEGQRLSVLHLQLLDGTLVGGLPDTGSDLGDVEVFAGAVAFHDDEAFAHDFLHRAEAMRAGQALAAAADGVVPLAESGLQDLRVFVVAARTIHRSEAQEVRQKIESVLRRERFGMELHAPDREVAVPQAHHEAVVGPRSDFEASREGLALDDERVVAGRVERIGQSLEEVGVVVEDRRGLAMHQVRGAEDAAAVDVPDGLVAKADAEQRLLAGEGADHVAGHAGFGGRTRTRRDHHAVRIQRERFLDRDLVVAEDLLLHAELAEVLHQVVGEGVVVIDDQEHVLTICLARQGVKESPKRVNKCEGSEVVRNPTSQRSKHVRPADVTEARRRSTTPPAPGLCGAANRSDRVSVWPVSMG